MEVTTHCNVQCKMCIRPQMIAKTGSHHLDWEVFQRVVAQAPEGARFCLQGTGEPFIHKRFYDMVRVCKDRGFYVETYTNGLLYDPKQVMDSGLDFLMISVLGAGVEKSDERIERGDFAKVLRKMGELRDMKNGIGKEAPKFGFNVCVMNENIDELPAVLELARKYGVSYVQFTPVGDNPDLLASSSEIERVRPAIEKAAQDAGIRIQLYDLKPGLHERFKTCVWPWAGYYVMVNGMIGPCCTRPHLPSAWLPGRAGEIADMRALWESTPYQDFRKALAARTKDSVPAMCRQCVEYLVEQ